MHVFQWRLPGKHATNTNVRNPIGPDDDQRNDYPMLSACRRKRPEWRQVWKLARDTLVLVTLRKMLEQDAVQRDKTWDFESQTRKDMTARLVLPITVKIAIREM
jgi:hypothetical protein